MALTTPHLGSRGLKRLYQLEIDRNIPSWRACWTSY